MDDMISIKAVSKSYGSTKAVDNLTLAVKKGEFFGFLGPNGAGKTTTIRVLTGIIQPDTGSISIAGFTNQQKDKTSRLFGVVPESRGFYDWMNALEYLSFFADLYEIPKHRIKEKIAQLLEQVDLLKSKYKRIGAYSRGMRQRLGLARALINNPRLLILDEPTLGLDPQGQQDIQKLLKQLNNNGVTIFYSSHLLQEVSELCSKIAIINQGKLVAQGTQAELMQITKSQNLTDVFLALTHPLHD
jgi:ABC-2 type transport system ATP-binding protein